ncbi:hypothetical protein ACKI1I_20615 [Streptomyces turgidiscabies]|uniref:hypothetical protein n=1 Tax=Streptomyces TaxID=1883 RepID=UPI00389ACAF8
MLGMIVDKATSRSYRTEIDQRIIRGPSDSGTPACRAPLPSTPVPTPTATNQ